MASNAQPPRRAPPSDAPLDPNERTSPSSTSVALGQPTAPAAAVRPDAPAGLPLLGEDHLLPLPPALVSAGEEARLKQSQEEEESRKRRAQSEENEGENCIICLQEVRDRTVIVTCGHDHFCFNCIGVWADQSRKCPLCSRPMGEYLLHDLQSPFPHVKYFLPPFAKPSTVHPQHPVLPPPTRRFRPRRNDRAQSEDGNDFERRLEKRREIYRWSLYAKHVASNPTTRYKPAPTPAQFASNPDLISRAQVFLRRELQVWTGVDIEFMVTYVISLMQSIDIRSDAAVRLLRDFLDVDFEDAEQGSGRAEHFAHEVYSFIRSPFRDLKLYDAAASYDAPPTSTAASSSRRLSTSRNRPAREPTAQARLASAFEDLLDDGAGVLGEALGDRAPAARVDDGYSSSGSEGSSRSSHGGRGRARSRSRGGRSSSSGSRSRSRSRSVSRGPRNRIESRDPSPRPARDDRRRSPSPRGRHPGPPLSPRRWNVYDSWMSPEESERLARARSANRGAWRPPARYDDRPTRREDHRPAPSGRRALPDQGAVFDQRPAKMPRLGGGPLGERRGPLVDRRPPPPRPSTQELVQADPLGEGMRAWSINDEAPVIAIDSDVAPQEADAHANLPRLLTRISGVDPSVGLQINGRAKGRNNGSLTSIRGAGRPSATASSEETSTRPTPVIKAKGAPRNVLLQRLAGALAESKADALRASARSAARASDRQSQPPAASSDQASSDSGPPEAATPALASSSAIGPASVKQAPARMKPDVSNLKSKILERLQAEKLRAGEGVASKVVGLADGQQASNSTGEETEEQVLRRQLLARRKA